MRLSTIYPLLLPVLVAGSVVPQAADSVPTTTLASTTQQNLVLSALLPRSTSDTTAASAPTLDSNAGKKKEYIDLRAAAIVVDPNAVQPPSAVIPAMTPGGTPVDQYSTTTQWVETKVNGVKTWVPVAITFTFAAVPDQAPLPGKGEVGMGTITGPVGIPRTANAAPRETGAALWKTGAFGAAVAWGVVGMVG